MLSSGQPRRCRSARRCRRAAPTAGSNAIMRRQRAGLSSSRECARACEWFGSCLARPRYRRKAPGGKGLSETPDHTSRQPLPRVGNPRSRAFPGNVYHVGDRRRLTRGPLTSARDEQRSRPRGRRRPGGRRADGVVHRPGRRAIGRMPAAKMPSIIGDRVAASIRAARRKLPAGWFNAFRAAASLRNHPSPRAQALQRPERVQRAGIQGRPRCDRSPTQPAPEPHPLFALHQKSCAVMRQNRLSLVSARTSCAGVALSSRIGVARALSYAIL